MYTSVGDGELSREGIDRGKEGVEILSDKYNGST
jgi:hypothetical protein